MAPHGAIKELLNPNQNDLFGLFRVRRSDSNLGQCRSSVHAKDDFLVEVDEEQHRGHPFGRLRVRTRSVGVQFLQGGAGRRQQTGK